MRLTRLLTFSPMRAPEEGGAATPPAGVASSGGGGPSGEGAVTPYRPEGLPDHLFGTSEKETLDKLWGAYKPARDGIAQMGELGKLPRDAEGYAFEPSEKLAPFLPNFAEDPVFKLVKQAAHTAGIRDKQFGPFIGAVMEAMIDGELVQAPVDLAAEKAALLPSDAATLDEAGKNAAIDRRVRDNHARIETWKARGLPPESAEALALMLDTAAGNKAMEYFAAQMRTPQPSLGGTAGGGVTHEQVKARQSDPRNKVGNAKFEPGFAAETDRMYQALFPG